MCGIVGFTGETSGGAYPSGRAFQAGVSRL